MYGIRVNSSAADSPNNRSQKIWCGLYGKRSRGRQVKRWRDDIVQMKGITWGRDAEQRDDWRRDAEGYILQWMDGASV